LHPEKVLMVRQSFASGRAEEHERLIAALLEACAWCDRPENRSTLSDMLANPAYVNAPAECLRAGFTGPFECGGRPLEHPSDLTIFNNHNANEPTDDKAHWLMDELYCLLKLNVFRNRNLDRTPVLKNVFRRDIFNHATRLLGPALASHGARDSQAINTAEPNGAVHGNATQRSSIPAGWWLALSEAALKPRG
jgi:NitT/TauT family transport system ATP-binding protein